MDAYATIQGKQYHCIVKRLVETGRATIAMYKGDSFPRTTGRGTVEICGIPPGLLLGTVEDLEFSALTVFVEESPTDSYSVNRLVLIDHINPTSKSTSSDQFGNCITKIEFIFQLLRDEPIGMFDNTSKTSRVQKKPERERQSEPLSRQKRITMVRELKNKG